jgi:cytochrome c oxidase subunit 2
MRTLRSTISTLKKFMWLPVVLAFTGCSTTLKQSALDPKGPVSQMQYDVMMLTLYVVTGLFIVVGGAMAYTVWRYRLKKGEDPKAIPDQSHGNPLIEVGLIVLSASMLVIIGIPTLKGIAYMKNDPVEEYEGEAIEIIVTGYQWWWNFEYPELGIKTSNEFSIPTGRPVKLVLKAADVIHSFWVPKLAGKTDLIPGQINRMWIEADEPGMYWGQCAEFCGDSHAYMLFRTIALEPAEFDAWVEHQKSAPVEPDSTLAHTGKALFTEKGCIGCHMVGKVGGLAGPDLTHFGSRATLAAGWKANTLENLKEWIQYPEKVKPGNLMYLGVGTMAGIKQIREEKGLSDDEVAALADYLHTLQ